MSDPQQQMIAGGFILLISLGVMGFWWWSLHLRINELKSEKAAAEAKIAQDQTTNTASVTQRASQFSFETRSGT